MIVYSGGINYYTPDAGTVKHAYCRACNTEMEVQRNVTRSAGKFGHPLPEPHRKEDIFTCPLSGQDWHQHILDLMREQGHTVSKKLKAIFQEEIEECRLQRKF